MTGDRIPDDVVDRVRAATDIVELVGTDLALTKDGADMKALCPFHEEKTPSLKVNPTRQRFKCFGCGVGGDAFDWLVRRRRISFPEAVRTLASEKGIEIPTNGNGAASGPSVVSEHEWDIRDPLGNVVATHLRRDLSNGRKKFSWRRNGEWNLGGLACADLPLYGSDLLASRPNERVLFTEGEKAADAARARGVLALGTVTGSSSAPGPGPLAALRGRDVILWPDNDEGGFDHMARVAAGLDGIAKSVRRVQWEGATEKGDDAADFKGTDDEFRALLDAAIEGMASESPREPGADNDGYVPIPPGDLGDEGATPNAAPGDGPGRVSLAWRTLRQVEADAKAHPRDWEWEGLLALRTVAVISGEPKGGKSEVLAAFVAAKTRGAEWLGKTLTKGRVVLVTEEGDHDLVNKLARYGADFDSIMVLSRDAVGVPPEWGALVKDAVERATAFGATILVIDTFSFWAAIEGEGERVEGVVREALLALQLARNAGLATALVHHNVKSKDVEGIAALRGSGAFAASVETVALYRRHSPSLDDAKRRLEVFSRIAPCATTTIERVMPETGEPHFVVVAGQESKPTGEGWNDRKIIDSLKAVGVPVPRKGMEELTGVAKRTLDSRLARLADNVSPNVAKIQRFGTGGPGVGFWYATLGVPAPSPEALVLRRAKAKPDGDDDEETAS